MSERSDGSVLRLKHSKDSVFECRAPRSTRLLRSVESLSRAANQPKQSAHIESRSVRYSKPDRHQSLRRNDHPALFKISRTVGASFGIPSRSARHDNHQNEKCLEDFSRDPGHLRRSGHTNSESAAVSVTSSTAALRDSFLRRCRIFAPASPIVAVNAGC